MSCLYILEINPLSAVSLAIIFSHSEGCLFTLFVVSFAAQKLLSFIRSHLFIYFLFALLWEVSQSVLFLSKSFIVSGLTSRSLIHFEFIFVCGVSNHSSSFF